MNARLLLLVCLTIASFFSSSCRRHAQIADMNADDGAAFKEDFSGVSKPAYNTAISIFKTGDWYLADALVNNGNPAAAVRIRNTGKLGMEFDVQGAQMVYVGFASYAGDQPSDWQLWMSVNGGRLYEQVGNTITADERQVQKVAFNVQQTGTVRFEVRKISGGKNRLLITSVAITNTSTASTTTQQPLHNTSQSTMMDGDNGNLLLGNPTNATHSISNPDNYLIDHGYYAESYSKTRCTPNWVSWHIGAGDLGSVDRLDNFRPDANLPNGWYEADDNSYKGSGFDKGHNCPSADRTAATVANSATFFMDNIVPQAPNNNQHTWEHLESYCRDEVKKGNEVYVIMGNYGTGGTGSKGYTTSIDGGRINVPAHIWKVVIILPDGNNDLSRISSSTRVIAIDTPNDNSIAPNWMNYVTTIAAIEKAADVHLLSAVPGNVESVLVNKKFTGAN